MPRGTVFFDYDGTLHNSVLVYGPAFRAGYGWLVSEGYAPEQQFSDEWISHWLGWSTRDMWTTFMPELEEEVWRQAAAIVGAEMDRLSSSGKGALFEGIPQALTALKENGYTLAFLSNCRHAYRDAHRAFYGLDQWFSSYHCAEDYPGEPKWQIYRHALEKSDCPAPRIMVGDRFHDLEVSLENGIPFIGCSYGFGLEDELEKSTVLVDSPDQIPDAVEKALSA